MGLFDEIRKAVRPYAEDEEDVFPEFPQPRERDREREKSRAADNPRDKVLNIHTTTQLQVVLVQPEQFEAASDIADHLRDRRTVVLNLEKANRDAVRRLVDFLSGVVYAQGGKIKPVARSTYIITPYNVDIMGGDLMDELESNGWYM
ncbi:MAG: cell division protein SepF [Oscillospiraceae bacterium]|nr:cell division protein SepF [Oscillospiraceae bacterium]